MSAEWERPTNVNEEEPAESDVTHSALLCEALRAIRKHRRMKTSEVATAMGLPVRTYEHLENGTGRVTYERLSRFAEATDSDPIAILAVVPMRSAEFAVRCADNKLMTIVLASLRELNEELASDIEYLGARTLIGGFDRLRKDLIDHVRGRDQFAERWMEEKAAKLDGAAFLGRKDRRT